MDGILPFIITVFTGFFAVSNPLSNMTVFMSLTEGADRETKDNITRRAVTIAFVIVAVFAVLGNVIFQLFDISIAAFKIAGGILVFFIGFEMLQSKKPSVKSIKHVEIDEDIAVTPLAIPIIAGPGTIVTAMNFVSDGSLVRIGIVILIFSIMCGLTYITFRLSNVIAHRLGNNVISVFGKIMGLLIAIIGTGMVIRGIKVAFDLV